MSDLATHIKLIYFYFSSSEADNQLSATHGEGGEGEATQSTGLDGLNQTSYNRDIADIISYS